MSTQKPKIFYGWYIVAASTLMIGGSVGILWNCFTVFVGPVCEAFGFSRGLFNFYATLAGLVSTVAMPFYGGLFKKFGQKKVMIVCSFVCCSLPVFLSMAAHLWQFYLVAMLQGMFVIGVDVMAVGTLINNWFRSHRGLATGIAYSGSSLTGMIAIPVVSRIVEAYGWQWGYRSMFAIAVVLILPAVLFVIKERPEDKGLRKLGDEETDTSVEAAEAAGLTRSEALKTPMFWMLGGALFFTALIDTGIAVNFIAFMGDTGFSPAFASGIVSGYMGIMCLAKLGLGSIFDKLGPRLGAVLTGIVNFLAPFALVFIGMKGMPYLFAFVFGLAYATLTVPPPMFTSAIFGDKNFSAIYGLVLMFTMIGGAVGAPMCGFFYDFTGSYHGAWLALAASGAIAAVLYVLAVSLGEKRRTW